MPEGSELKVASSQDPRGSGTLGSVVFLLSLMFAAAMGTQPLNDNSFWTHLATGRLILERGSVPSTDPYTYTAEGEPWTVQSWLASVVYATAEQLGSDMGLRILILIGFLAATAVLWAITRPAHSMVTRILLMGSGLFIAAGLWTERPYMVGVIGLGLVWLALENDIPAWLLGPLMWIWVNSHGSWVLAFAVVAAVVGGSILDRRSGEEPWPPSPVERSVIAWTTAGAALGAINPLGPKMLVFPLLSLTKRDAFRTIVEWRPPDYSNASQLAYLGLFVVTVLLLARGRSWRMTLPAVLFGFAGVYAQRNIVMGSVVLLAVAARAAPHVGTLTVKTRLRVGAPMQVLAGVVLILVCQRAATEPAVPPAALEPYPARALAWLDLSAPGRLATQDFSGNFLEVLDGPNGEVFVDDRYDMFPKDTLEQIRTVVQARPGWKGVLKRYEVDAVVWNRDGALGAVLTADPDWVVRYSDSQWIIACRRERPCRG